MLIDSILCRLNPWMSLLFCHMAHPISSIQTHYHRIVTQSSILVPRISLQLSLDLLRPKLFLSNLIILGGFQTNKKFIFLLLPSLLIKIFFTIFSHHLSNHSSRKMDLHRGNILHLSTAIYLFDEYTKNRCLDNTLYFVSIRLSLWWICSSTVLSMPTRNSQKLLVWIVVY